MMMRIGRPLTLSSGTCRVLKSVPVRPISSVVLCRRIRDVVVFSANPDTEEARSPLDAPQEWEPPLPSRRADIFPEFEKMERVFLPKPLPGDPEMPDEEMEESRKRTEPGDPDPEGKPGEPSEPEEKDMPESDPEKKQSDIPDIPQ